jgi:hypothetical protein
MKIGDLMKSAKDSIKSVRIARANHAVRALDVYTLKPFSTATKIEDIVRRVDTLAAKLQVHSNEGLHLVYQLGADVQVYRVIRALQSGMSGMITWDQVEEEDAFKWFVPFLCCC